MNEKNLVRWTELSRELLLMKARKTELEAEKAELESSPELVEALREGSKATARGFTRDFGDFSVRHYKSFGLRVQSYAKLCKTELGKLYARKLSKAEEKEALAKAAFDERGFSTAINKSGLAKHEHVEIFEKSPTFALVEAKGDNITLTKLHDATRRNYSTQANAGRTLPKN